VEEHFIRDAGLTVRINECKNVISRDVHPSLLGLNLVCDKEDIPIHVLKHDRLGSDEAKNQNEIQKASFAFDDQLTG